MQLDFHYYATYCAAVLAGYSHEESLAIGYSSQFVDMCSKTFLMKVQGPVAAATTQLTMEMADVKKGVVGRQDITRIWASFHFLPYDLYAQKKRCTKAYLNKYRLICNPNGSLVADTVRLAKATSLQAAGIAMHVLADTWAHRYHAGTPSLVINNSTNFYEYIDTNDTTVTKAGEWRKIVFVHKLGGTDDVFDGKYIASVYQPDENSVMNLGHGRDGHLPDYSFAKYRFIPAWKDYEEILKDNPSDYYSAFGQMVYALKYLKTKNAEFELDTYDETIEKYRDEIMAIIKERRPDASAGWKNFGEKLSGRTIEDFDVKKYIDEYVQAQADSKSDTFLGRFFVAALNQKSMISAKIFKSGNILAGFSVDFGKKGFKGIKDYKIIVESIGKDKNEC